MPERKTDGLIDITTYHKNRERLNSEKEKLEKRIGVLETERGQAEAVEDPEVERLLDAVAKYSSAYELDNEMVLAFVEKVLIYDEEHVEIKWNFSDKLISVVMGK